MDDHLAVIACAYASNALTIIGIAGKNLIVLDFPHILLKAPKSRGIHCTQPLYITKTKEKRGVEMRILKGWPFNPILPLGGGDGNGGFPG